LFVKKRGKRSPDKRRRVLKVACFAQVRRE
jgi:hypothetical protein